MRKTLIGTLVTLTLLGGGSLWWLKAQTLPASVQLSANPAIVTVGTTTQVKFTAAVTSTSAQVPSGMNLLRISSTGTSSILTAMRDDGTNGDTIAGDKVFTVLLTLHENQVGTFGLQASVAIRGQLKRALSPVMPFAALAPTSVPVVLPPDPGEAGKTTLAGIDSDSDGVRDDIQRYIVFSTPTSEKARSSLMQFARGAQSFLLSGVNGTSPSDAFTYSSSGRYCLYFIVGFHESIPVRDALVAELLNTRPRTAAYVIASNALGGTVLGSVGQSAWKAHCSFNPDQMVN